MRYYPTSEQQVPKEVDPSLVDFLAEFRYTIGNFSIELEALRDRVDILDHTSTIALGVAITALVFVVLSIVIVASYIQIRNGVVYVERSSDNSVLQSCSNIRLPLPKGSSDGPPPGSITAPYGRVLEVH